MTEKLALTAERMIDAINQSNGYASKAASVLGVSRATFYNYLKRFSTAQEAWTDIREKRHDFVESKLMTAIDDGNITAIIFYLKTQCKDRGYVERQELTGQDGGPVVVRIVDEDEGANA